MIKTYTETAHGIQLHVSTWFDEQKSNLVKQQFCHTFRIQVLNEREDEIRFLLRRWIIEESGQIPRVYEGAGIQGRIPNVLPGEGFMYEITVPFHAPNLRLTGRYLFQSADGAGLFEVVSPTFYIAAHIFN